MKGIFARYNELGYEVIVTGSDGWDEEVIYRAGNSPLDSQVYVSAEEGVGKKEMKQCAEDTAKELAEERELDFIGVEYEEIED